MADELRTWLMRTAESSAAAVIVLDLSDVCFIDANCAGVIMGAWESAGRHGGRLEVAGLHGIPELVFNLLGLAPILVRRTDISDGGRDPGDRLARRRHA